MKIATLLGGALFALALTTATTGLAATWPPLNLGPFADACHAHPGLQSMVAGQPDTGGPAIDRLCTCFSGKLEDASVSQSDADMLTRDLLGTVTDDERQAYATYEDLSSFASDSLDACMANLSAPVAAQPAPEPEEAAAPAPAQPAPAPPAEVAAAPEPAPEPAPVPQPTTPEPAPSAAVTPPPAAPPAQLEASVPPVQAPVPAGQPHRMSAAATSFLNGCAASGPFSSYLKRVHSGDASPQGGICSCLTGALSEKVADSDLPVLARDFFENRESAAPTENYAAIAQVAQDSLRSCMKEAGVAPGF